MNEATLPWVGSFVGLMHNIIQENPLRRRPCMQVNEGKHYINFDLSIIVDFNGFK